MFAITCSHKFLDKYIEIITAENDEWRSQFANGRSYTQELQLSWLRLCDALPLTFCQCRFCEYELVVLQPGHFLPHNALLPLYL